jgi:hypothetical protein
VLLGAGRVFKIGCAVLFLLTSVGAWGQAKVNENLESVFIYVDTNAGSDSNPGTKSQPLKTIAAAAAMAMQNNYNGIGSRVFINPGTYRESISILGGSRSTSLPITFKATTNGTVFISGADIWTGWKAYSGNKKIFTLPWPFQWGLCGGDSAAPAQQAITLRQEMIIVNGTPLTEVLSLAEMQPGTFFPDETGATVYLWPPTGTTMSTAVVEVATRPQLFRDNRQSNVVLRGLTFQYANSCAQRTAVQIGRASNVLIDTDNFVWNNGIGLAINADAQNFTVQNSVFNHNGELGFNTHLVKYGLWQSDVAAYNNWRGAQGAFYSWDTGGGKFLLDHNSTFNNLTTVFNQAHGAAFDTDNQYASFTSFVSVGNVGDGFLAEKSQGPLTYSNSYLCGNNLAQDPGGSGFGLRDSSFVSLTNTVLFGNIGPQIRLDGHPNGYQIPTWETHETLWVLNRDLTFSGISASSLPNTPVFSDGYLSGIDWTQFTSTFVSDNNTWWASSGASAFTVPIPVNWTTLTLPAWKSLTGQDTHSRWTAVSSPAACDVSEEGADYWLLVTGGVSPPVQINSSGIATWSLATISLGGMQGTVNLSSDLSAIPGASAKFKPASIGTSATSVLTLTVPAGTPSGQYPVTFIGNLGSVTRTVTVSVVVP